MGVFYRIQMHVKINSRLRNIWKSNILSLLVCFSSWVVQVLNRRIEQNSIETSLGGWLCWNGVDRKLTDEQKWISQNGFFKMYFSKYIFQNVFFKMYFSKCILKMYFLVGGFAEMELIESWLMNKNVFFIFMYFSKCISRNVFLKLYLRQLLVGGLAEMEMTETWLMNKNGSQDLSLNTLSPWWRVLSLRKASLRRKRFYGDFLFGPLWFIFQFREKSTKKLLKCIFSRFLPLGLRLVCIHEMPFFDSLDQTDLRLFVSEINSMLTFPSTGFAVNQTEQDID